MTNQIFLDYNSTTPVDPSVLDEMIPWFTAQPGNAASAHVSGRIAAVAVEAARDSVAHLLGVRSSEVVWTSGATESNNTVIRGLERLKSTRDRLLVGATEHKAVLETAMHLREFGWIVDVIPVDRRGLIDIEVFRSLLGEDVALVSVMIANNETGVVNPVEKLVELAHDVGALFHSDCAQAPGRISLDLGGLNVDFASISAHKMYGPKGVGCLYVNRRTDIEPLLLGGGHERGLRSGTTNVPGVVGFGAAARIVEESLQEESKRLEMLSDMLLSEFENRVDEMEVVGNRQSALPNTLCIRFHGADAEAVVANSPSVAFSSGSACSSLIPSSSHVLRAMGMSEDEAFECVRFSVGRMTTASEIEEAAEHVAAAVERVRSLNSRPPVATMGSKGSVR